jgi:hypothetical protein
MFPIRFSFRLFSSASIIKGITRPFWLYLLPLGAVFLWSCFEQQTEKTAQKITQALTQNLESDPTQATALADTVLSEPKANLPHLKDTLTVIGVGDMMFGTNYPSEAHLPPDEGRQLLAPVLDILKSADLTFGNLEGVVLDKGGTVKHCSNPAICYAFRMPEKYASVMVEAGFDMVSIANNHVGDFGQEGRENTVNFLKRVGIAGAGLLSCPTAIVEKEGIKYGLAAFAPNSGTVDIRDIEGAKKIVSDLAQKVDIVVVSFHGGAEGSNRQHVTRQTETFLGENRGNVYAFSHAVIDAGADIVFGHGPHVTRALELYKDRLIAYSLGNFCTYDRFNLKGVSGLAPILAVQVGKDGTFYQAQITATQQLGRGGVSIDTDKKVIKVLQNLTKTDFPETPLQIDEHGKVTKK